MIKIKFNESNDFHRVSFSRDAVNIVTLKGNFPKMTTGFLTFKDIDENYPLGNFSDYTTIYRVFEDGAQYSNNGSVWVEPTINITVGINWNDEGNKEEVRPESVDVKVDGEVVTLNEENGWQKTYMELPSGSTLDVEFDDIQDYTLVVNGTTATYTHECIPEPTLEERVSDLEEAVCELADAL